MIELGISTGARRVERHNYTRSLTGAVEQWAESGLFGALHGAIEIAASHYARAFAVATVEPTGRRTAGLTPAVLASIARRLIARGESCHLIDVDAGRVELVECSEWSLYAGGPRPESWRYRCTQSGPHETPTEHVPGDQVVHCRYATNADQPWIGLSPLTLAGTTGRLARELERSLADESGGPVGSVIPLPTDAGDASDDPDDAADTFAPLKRQINTLRGRCGLVETTAAGYGEGRAAAPGDDWKPRRIGPQYTDAENELRAAVEETVLSVCGIPPGLARAAGGESRESYRRWYAAGVLPLARLVETELQHKLDTPALRLTFADLAAADVHGRARAWRSLAGNEATVPDAEARRIVGL